MCRLFENFNYLSCSKQLKQDCEELQQLLKLATRSNVRQLIASEITLLQGKIPKAAEDLKATDAQKGIPSSKEEGSHVYTQKIQSYGKFYLVHVDTWSPLQGNVEIYKLRWSTQSNGTCSFI